MNTELLKRLESATMPELYALAYQDPLTGLLNRRAFEADTREWIVLIDMDSFKWINDTFGHSVGDAQLVEFAASLTDMFGADNCYRIGGDEFAVKGHVSDAAKWRREWRGEDLRHASTGVGTSTKLADHHLTVAKVGREAAGLRAQRGEAPPWADEFYAKYTPVATDRRAQRG